MTAHSALKKIIKPAVNLLDRAGFKPILDKISIISMDVGARGAFTPDLLPIARCVTAIGFEPDPVEVKRLQESAKGPWKKLTYLPFALGAKKEKKLLNLYSKAGCSSLLTAKKDIGAQFGRGDYYDLKGTAQITLEPLDDICGRENVPLPDHIKVDIQGAEMDMFTGGNACIDHCLAIRSEISFLGLYHNQPLFADIDSYLRGKGYVLMEFTESHSWRRRSRIKWPKNAPGPIPHSRGQLVHGDALYMRAPESLPESTPAQRDRKLKLALIAAAYQFIDHAAACTESKAMKTHCQETYGVDVNAALARLSRKIGGWPCFYRRLKLPA